MTQRYNHPSKDDLKDKLKIYMTKELHDLELDREGNWIKLGKDRYDKSEKKNQSKGRNSVTPPFVYVQKQLLVPLAERVEIFIKSQYKVAGGRHTASEPLKDLNDPKRFH